MLTAEQLGERLRDARVRRGLSQQAVADALKLPRTAVTNMEAGIRAVSTLELTMLAQLYKYPASFFLEGEGAAREDAFVVLPRALDQDANYPSFRAAVENVLALCREGAALRAMLDGVMEETLPSYAVKVNTPGEAIRQGELVAREERRKLGIGTAPVGNIAGLISDQGIWVAACKLPRDMSGLFTHDRQSGLAIIIQADHGPARRRFSYAHEYGHALFDRAEPFRFTRQANSAELVEKRANAFAAAFVMPAVGIDDQLRQLNKGGPSRQAQSLYNVAGDAAEEVEIRSRPGSQTITYQDVASIARHFEVSYDAAVWRLKNLGHLNASDARVLLDQREDGKRYMSLLRFRGLFEEDAVPDDQRELEFPDDQRELELRSQIAKLSVEAFLREEISQGRLREIAQRLDISASDLVELAEAARAG